MADHALPPWPTLPLARCAAADGFAAHTPLMDAGLDSLDMLKLARWGGN